MRSTYKKNIGEKKFQTPRNNTKPKALKHLPNQNSKISKQTTYNGKITKFSKEHMHKQRSNKNAQENRASKNNNNKPFKNTHDDTLS